MPTVRRGHLTETSQAPVVGETTSELLRLHGVVVEEILSGELAAPVEYDQDHDEWVVLLAGDAELEVGGERLSLVPGDWVLLPWHTPHRLVHTGLGCRWLAVHFPREAPSDTPRPIRRAPTR